MHTADRYGRKIIMMKVWAQNNYDEGKGATSPSSLPLD